MTRMISPRGNRLLRRLAALLIVLAMILSGSVCAVSAATLPFVYVLAAWQGWTAVLAFALIVSVIGIWAADTYAKAVNIKDPGFIVIDETAGQAITLLAAGTNLWLYLIGFALFRLLDISKPWPVGWADKNVKGGLGIMLDDILAGIIGGVILYFIRNQWFS